MILDLQVELIRDIARQYSSLKTLSRLPDSLDPMAPCKIVDDVRSMALAFILNEVVLRTVKEVQEMRAAGAAEDDLHKAPKLSVPRSITTRYVGIPAIEYGPLDLVSALNSADAAGA